MSWFDDWSLPVICAVIFRLYTRMPYAETDGAFDVLQHAPVVN
jgi:hypothetical protein